MAIFNRLLNTLTRRGDPREAIAEELLFHLEEKTRANLNAGMDYATARESAVRSCGNRSWFGDAMRDVRRDMLLAFAAWRGGRVGFRRNRITRPRHP
jgi:hypothetical protein